MSGLNTNRNPSISYSEVNTQKTLIYDLRSQLSNLKSQFSRLISKPTDLSSKSKIQPKTTLKSRYSYVASDTDLQTHHSVSSYYYGGSRSTDLLTEPNLSLLKKVQHNIDHKNIPVTQKLNHNYRRSSDQENLTNLSLPINISQEKLHIQQKKGNLDSSGTKQFATFIKKQHNILEIQGKINTAPHEVHKVVNNIPPNNNNLSEQLHNAQQKVKKLEQQNHQKATKLATSLQSASQLHKKITRTEKQFQDLKTQNNSNNQKIKSLQQFIKQLTQKSIKTNQQTALIIKQKNKQIELIKQCHAQQFKNKQKDYQNLLSAEKQHLQSKADSVITTIKQQYEKKIKQGVLDRQKLLEELSSNKQICTSLKAQVNQLQTKKQADQHNLAEKDQEIMKQTQIINKLKLRQTQLQKQIIQKPIKPSVIQFGINTQQQPIPAPQSNITPTTTTPVPNPTQSPYKQMQDKLTIYLNNIDKQSQKIKEQKAQIQKLQKKVQQNNRIVSQKQSTIRNVMRDCKALQKDLNQNRRMRRQLQLLLEQSTINQTKLNLKALNNKYKNICQQTS